MARFPSSTISRKKIIQYSLFLLIVLGCIILGASEQTTSNTIRHVLGNRFENIYKNNQTLIDGSYRVAKVDDGDTIVVDMNGREEKVRFIGVDTPETKDPRKPVQCYGHAAAEFTKKMINDQPVRLEADPINTNRDRYNRLLRYVYLADGTLLNGEIIKQGYGFAYVGFPFEKIEAFKEYETEAREANKGLWGNCQPTKNKHGGYDANPDNSL